MLGQAVGLLRKRTVCNCYQLTTFVGRKAACLFSSCRRPEFTQKYFMGFVY